MDSPAAPSQLDLDATPKIEINSPAGASPTAQIADSGVPPRPASTEATPVPNHPKPPQAKDHAASDDLVPILHTASDVNPTTPDVKVPDAPTLPLLPDSTISQRTGPIPVTHSDLPRASAKSIVPPPPGARDNPAPESNRETSVQDANDAREPVRSVHPTEQRVVRPHAPEHSSNQQPGKEDSKPQDSKPQNTATSPENPSPKTHFHIEGQSPAMQVTKDTRDTHRMTPDAVQPTAKSFSVETAPAIRPQPAREINLKLEASDATKVDVRLTERAGKVQVQVRTQDHELTKSLQGNLGDLVGRLENKGFKAEAWIPSTARHVQSAASPTANPGSGNSDSSGSPAREQQQQQQRHSGNGRQRSRWNAQLNDTLSEETRSNVQ